MDGAKLTRTHIYLSCSKRDEEYKNRLLKHFSPAQRRFDIDIWDDSKVAPGDDWRTGVDEALSKADIALVLISADYFDSPWLNEHELPRLLELSSNRELVVIPIVVRACEWLSTPLARYQALPRDGKPIGQRNDADSAWVRIVEEVVVLARSRGQARPSMSSVPALARSFDRAAAPAEDTASGSADTKASVPRSPSSTDVVVGSVPASNPPDSVREVPAGVEDSPNIPLTHKIQATEIAQRLDEAPTSDAPAPQVSDPVATPSPVATLNRNIAIAPGEVREPLEVRQHAVADRPAQVDELGFAPSVRALAGFLTAKATQPPLTVSIEGEWGSGKSSFMLQLRERLDSIQKTTVSFNAWKHDKQDELWAAFALDLIRQLGAKRSVFRRLVCNVLLQWKRLKARKSVLSALSLATTVLLVLLVPLVLLGLPFKTAPLFLELLSSKDTPETTRLLASLFGTYYQHLVSLGRWAVVGAQFAGSFFALRVFWMKFGKALGNPLELDLSNYIENPAYEDRLSFLQRLHSDLALVLDAYTGTSPVYVFIDDLDRCETPKSAELMQGLNLMTESDSRLIFVLGMDRDKVASAFAAKHKDIVKYLPSSSKTHEENESLRGLEYGHSFIEKFVQVPFRIPRPQTADIAHFVAAMTGTAAPTTGSVTAPVSQGSVGLTTPSRSGSAEPTPSSKAASTSGAGHPSPQRLDAPLVDTPLVAEMLKMVAPSMDYNPRRLKQFLNLLRLALYVGRETDLFENNAAFEYTITPEQLAKFTAISIRWPLFVMDLQQDSTLLERLHSMAVSPLPAGEEVSPDLVRWIYRPQLLDLIRAGCLDNPPLASVKSQQRYSMAKFDVVRFLRVVALPEPPGQGTSSTAAVG